MDRILGIIPARGGSKGIPRKNIIPLAGKPLIGWTIEAALSSTVCNRLIVSTDDPEIAAVARDFGAEIPFLRPSLLSSDTATSFSVVEHAINWFEEECSEIYNKVLFLQPTSPLRTATDIRNAVDIGKKGKAAVVSVCEPQHHPYLCKIIRQDGTLANLFPESDKYTRRQDYPLALTLNGAIYITPSNVLKTEKTFTPKKTLPYIMPQERSLDIDTPWDFFLAEQIMKARKE